MSILLKIKHDQVQARKEKNKFNTKLLTTLLSEAARPGLDDGKRQSTDDEVICVIKKFIKNIQDTLIHCQDNQDMVTEMGILECYLPTQLSEQQLQHIVRNNDCGLTMGDIMKYLKNEYSGQYDGKMASNVVKEFLS